MPAEIGITTLEIIELQKAQIESQSQIVQLELEQEGNELEGINLLPKQIESIDIELIPYQTKLEEPKLQLVQPKIQSKELKLDIEVSKAK